MKIDRRKRPRNFAMAELAAACRSDEWMPGSQSVRFEADEARAVLQPSYGTARW